MHRYKYPVEVFSTITHITILKHNNITDFLQIPLTKKNLDKPQYKHFGRTDAMLCIGVD